ncbi:MAG: class I SAM-dependent methyltransferase [Nitrospirae bacterium]|nr:class I SAM-dependent methyltransferase [Nitrospirota bacterium]
MRNAASWRPSKYRLAAGRLRAALDPSEVQDGSLLVTELIAMRYDRALARHCRGHLLDLGCGKAPLYGFYRDRVVSATTADWPHSTHGADHVDQQVDLNGPIPLESERFDVIILSDVLEHLLRPQVLWGEMARLLRPGGVLLLNVPFMYWLHEEPHDYHRYTEHALRAEAGAVGLHVLELEPVGGIREVLADMLGKALGTVPLAGGQLARLIQRAAYWRYVARGCPRGDQWPLLYFLVAQKPEADRRRNPESSAPPKPAP